MTATNERTDTSRISRSRVRRRHADAVIQAEVRRLARALAQYRVLPSEVAGGYRLENPSSRPRLPAA